MEREKATKREAYSREVDALNRAAGEVSKQEDAVSASGAAQNGISSYPTMKRVLKRSKENKQCILNLRNAADLTALRLEHL
ncbi:uncharacterized protein KRP23_5113 [Phytophthora ramorum]|uniref:uncharacterized protein n=1 Tax=Phytophthora ramorum TaxID=164328 RepID=UPI0030AA2CD3|nr:hypothetical protein KRP23_5113 [Phytophthora ramorum]